MTNGVFDFTLLRRGPQTPGYRPLIVQILSPLISLWECYEQAWLWWFLFSYPYTCHHNYRADPCPWCHSATRRWGLWKDLMTLSSLEVIVKAGKASIIILTEVCTKPIWQQLGDLATSETAITYGEVFPSSPQWLFLLIEEWKQYMA